jgi:hypothetical protein
VLSARFPACSSIEGDDSASPAASLGSATASAGMSMKSVTPTIEAKHFDARL